MRYGHKTITAECLFLAVGESDAGRGSILRTSSFLQHDLHPSDDLDFLICRSDPVLLNGRKNLSPHIARWRLIICPFFCTAVGCFGATSFFAWLGTSQDIRTLGYILGQHLLGASRRLLDGGVSFLELEEQGHYW